MLRNLDANSLDELVSALKRRGTSTGAPPDAERAVASLSTDGALAMLTDMHAELREAKADAEADRNDAEAARKDAEAARKERDGAIARGEAREEELLEQTRED